MTDAHAVLAMLVCALLSEALTWRCK